MQFKKIGKIEKDHAALRVDVPAWKLGELVIAAGDIPALLNGRAVDIQFVQRNEGREPFVGYAGTAYTSRSGRAINLTIEGVFYSVPAKDLRGVVDSTRAGAPVSKPAPVIDADAQQRERIDKGLCLAW